MNWGALLSTFGLLFVAELGDKTQLAVLTQTCKYRRPWAVFLGASLALAATTALAVAGGELLGRLVPRDIVRWVAAVLFVVVGLGMLVGVLRRAPSKALGEACDCPEGESEAPADAEAAASRRANWRAFAATFGLLFVAELGDKTQLAALTQASKYHDPLPVFAGGALALAAVSALGVVGGQGLCLLLPERQIKLLAALAFVVMGVLIGCGVF